MNLQGLLRIVVVGVLLVGPFGGCIFTTESEPKVPVQKGGVKVKVDRNTKGLDVDVDVKKPGTP